MKIITQPYQQIKQIIIDANLSIKMIDLWNNQIANTEQENIITPAVFIEFADLNFQEQQQALQAAATVRIHAIQHQFKQADEALVLIDKIIDTLYNIAGDNFTQLIPTAYSPDFDHDMLRHDVLEFSTYLWHELPINQVELTYPDINVNIDVIMENTNN